MIALKSAEIISAGGCRTADNFNREKRIASNHVPITPTIIHASHAGKYAPAILTSGSLPDLMMASMMAE